MYIEAKPNSVHVKESCLVCGIWDRAGDVAYFETESQSWVCDACVESGIEKMRDNLREAAVHHREIADRYESSAAGPIEVAEESKEVREERARVQAFNARENMRHQNSPYADDLPF